MPGWAVPAGHAADGLPRLRRGEVPRNDRPHCGERMHRLRQRTEATFSWPGFVYQLRCWRVPEFRRADGMHHMPGWTVPARHAADRLPRLCCGEVPRNNRPHCGERMHRLRQWAEPTHGRAGFVHRLQRRAVSRIHGANGVHRLRVRTDRSHVECLGLHRMCRRNSARKRRTDQLCQLRDGALQQHRLL